MLAIFIVEPVIPQLRSNPFIRTSVTNVRSTIFWFTIRLFRWCTVSLTTHENHDGQPAARYHSILENLDLIADSMARFKGEKVTMPVGRTDVGEKIMHVTRSLLSWLDELRSWVLAYVLRLPITNYTMMEDYRNWTSFYYFEHVTLLVFSLFCKFPFFYFQINSFLSFSIFS